MNSSTSNKTLFLSTLAALLLAILIYFIIVLPAEFNIDYTGLGKRLGLTKLSDEKLNNTNLENQMVENQLKMLSQRQDEIEITVPANRGIEYKFSLYKYGRLNYDWHTVDKSDLYFDFHGEPKGDTTGFYESYSIAKANHSKGTVTMPFEGIHGWYWKNSTDKDIVVRLKSEGQYLLIDK